MFQRRPFMSRRIGRRRRAESFPDRGVELVDAALDGHAPGKGVFAGVSRQREVDVEARAEARRVPERDVAPRELKPRVTELRSRSPW